jgi:hypothetical protein
LVCQTSISNLQVLMETLSLLLMIFCALRSLIHVILFNSSKDALLIIIGVAILDYIDFTFWKKNNASIWQQSTIMKQAKIIDSDNICTIVTQKGMWEKKYQSVHTIKKMLLTKMILDTTWSEDLSHTTMREKNLCEHFFL